ncbi:hypothetical protein PBRA_002921 [Plasmodiophora brassicae]|uniref:Uncharacterized protein n=1 Tax=Plasmodiophora brassicae TaxID=37360 RepID=A0A0G4J6N4_PLABS|nr:hypothetical protein PBRA_002921 [Plasmodiophora brassicae]
MKRMAYSVFGRPPRPILWHGVERAEVSVSGAGDGVPSVDLHRVPGPGDQRRAQGGRCEYVDPEAAGEGRRIGADQKPRYAHSGPVLSDVPRIVMLN